MNVQGFSVRFAFLLIFVACEIGVSSWRYDGIGVAPGPNVIPTRGQIWPKPLKRTEEDGYLVVRPSAFSFKINGHDCDLLQAAFTRYYGVMLTASRRRIRTSRNKSWRKDINFLGYLDSLKVELSTPCEDMPHAAMEESYDLHIAKEGSWLSSKSVWGILQGLETFIQTVVLSPDGAALVVKVSETQDSPRYKHRGLLLDTSRHYLPVQYILRTLNAMEASKLNVFHWHIVDDQSFPYQSAAFPELSNKGAYNPLTHIYTREDMFKIIEHARLRGIRVIPEFDTPGHTRSWGLGIEGLLTPCYGGNYRRGLTPDGSYGPIDPSKSENYEFLMKFFDEVRQLFPDQYIHLGGDEVSFECWKSNPDINEFMAANNLTGDYAGLEEYYIQKLVDMVKTLNVSNIVWQEVFDNGVRIPPETVVQVWIPRGSQNEMSQITAKGYSVLLSSCWYLDALSSGGDWKKFYDCDPENFPGTPEQKELVLGGEVCMWGEVVDWTNLEPRVWPRACAAAEKLWSSPEAFSKKTWSSHLSTGNNLDNYDIDEVAARLEEHRCRLVQRGIKAQPPNGSGFCPGERW
ncbi:beta-hexosaminidase subunit alpha-like [Hetaerina americana]|uniref:beta-hexosaminidase subunit alpha-like n=1 Tax=Hetaerina americana TaxID=62018 RepID=UPI003A7F33A9